MRDRCATCSLVAIVLCATACGSPTSPTPSTFNVSGRVLDFQTGAPVSGAAVAFGDIDSGPFRATATAVSDIDGNYSVTVPPASVFGYHIEVNGVFAGLARPGMSYRGDLFVNVGTCIARYGTVVDARTARPIAGAQVTLVGKSTITDALGWYRLDFGCPSTPPLPGNTTFMSVYASGYAVGSESIGRGVNGVERRDVSMTPQ